MARPPRSSVRALTAALLLVGASACSSSSAPTTDSNRTGDTTSGDGGALAACDPLAPPPTALATVLGAGKDAEGVTYVADLPAGDSTPRVFVTSGASLRRAHVAGSGVEGSGASASYIATFESNDSDGSDARTLIVQMGGATAASMALAPASAGKSFAGGTPLTLVDASTVTGLPIVNLPGIVSYVADVSDGTVIAVTSPMDDTSATFHLYYGPPSAMAERVITRFVQATSGYPTIDFTVGAATYTMAISGSFTGLPEVDGGDAGGSSGPGPGTLTTGGGTLPFTVRTPAPPTLAGLAFRCFTP